MMTALRRFFLIAAASLFSGCLTGGDSLYGQNGGGVEDFPNTVALIGATAAQDFAAATDLSAVQNLQLPEIPSISGLDSLRIEPALGKRALAKGAAVSEASADCVPVFWTWNIAEFLYYRRIRKITCDAGVASIRRDTLTYWYAGSINPDSAKLPDTREEFEATPDSFVTLVGSRGSIMSIDSSKVQYFRVENLDSLGTLDWGDFRTVQTEAGGASSVQRVKVLGRDGAYLSPSAVPHEYEFLRVNAAGDTLEWKRMRDIDGDTAFWGASGTGLVTYESKVRNPAAEPGTEMLSTFLKAEIRHDGDGETLRQLYYRDARRLKNGGRTAFAFIGTAPDSVLRGNDTARIVSDTVFPLGDTALSFSSVCHLKLGSTVENMSSHALVDYSTTRTWRKGGLRLATTSFVPDSHSTPSQVTGRMDYKGAYANGDSTLTRANISLTGMEMEFRQIHGGVVVKFYRLVYDLLGNLLEAVDLNAPAVNSPTP